jgi:hypothetical protein
MRFLEKTAAFAVVVFAHAAFAQAPPPAPATAAPPAAAPPAAPAAAPPPAAGAAPAAAPAAPAGQDAAASLLKVYVFPANSQTPDVQAKDSNDCYAWAKQQTGVDPTNPTVPAKADTSQAGKGAAVKGAAKGALVGAAVGSASGDADTGAGVGAAAGAVGGIKKKKGAQQKAEAQAAQQQQAAVDEQIGSFKKAYTACMEGKKYTVK